MTIGGDFYSCTSFFLFFFYFTMKLLGCHGNSFSTKVQVEVRVLRLCGMKTFPSSVMVSRFCDSGKYACRTGDIICVKALRMSIDRRIVYRECRIRIFDVQLLC